jgi:purine-nucleoside phosphorylase
MSSRSRSTGRRTVKEPRPSSAALREQVQQTVTAIRRTIALIPDIAVVLGSGLGAFSRQIQGRREIAYGQLPHFPVSTVQGHRGALIFGTIKGRRVVAMEGRFHLYEGYSAAQVTYPIRVLRALGAKVLIISNAAGGLNPLFAQGDLMLIADQIGLLMGVSPLTGPNDERLGPRFPDMSAPYDPALLALAASVALQERMKVQRGVYVGVPGPSLETRAEYRMLRALGADAVGMSTVPEVIAAAHAGMRVLGISCITDLCLPDRLKPLTIEDVLRVAGETEPKLTRLVLKVIEGLKT